MTHYIENLVKDPCHNLALEQFLFDQIDNYNGYFMLWQNHNSIIIGKHQNTHAEINTDFVKEKNITVVRRLSGGGAVYHDLGNLNFTFINPVVSKQGIDFSVFCGLICKALNSLGVPAEIFGRNDIVIEGKKISGNAQYIKHGKILHHGTLLYDSNLGILSQALNPGNDKIQSKGIKSVQSRVTNIRPYMKTSMNTNEFWFALRDYMYAELKMNEYILTAEQNDAVKELKENIYSSWSWNYGESPAYTMRKERRIEGCGKIEILLDIDRGGKIKNIVFYGDYFNSADPVELEKSLISHHLEYNEIKTVLAETDISKYFHGLDNETFLDLII